MVTALWFSLGFIAGFFVERVWKFLGSNDVISLLHSAAKAKPITPVVEVNEEPAPPPKLEAKSASNQG